VLPTIRQRHFDAFAIALVAVISIAAAGGRMLLTSDRIVYGAAQQLGQGRARTFLEREGNGQPVALGVALSRDALDGLPQRPLPGGPSAVNLTLALPAGAGQTGYDHVMLDWNPGGHEPEHVYTLPHFDFHFFLTSPAERDAIMQSDPAWAAKAARFPAAEFIAEGYAAASTLGGITPGAAAVPMMGMHWLDVKSPELQRPPHGRPFTSTFIYGSWDGRVNFVEPMITKAFIESVRSSATGVTLPVSVPARAQKPGLYPTRYTILFDESKDEYRIAIGGFVPRN
jgi:hypothetical protein